MNNSDMVNQDYLLHEQYKDASNFNARLRIMQSLNAKPYAWYPWIFSLLKMAPHSRVLELGCGPGYLWKKNLERIPANCEITLSDFSPGMLKEAQSNLSESGHHFTFQVIDAQAIPFEKSHFDLVIANLMLYHIPDRPRALSEIARVLKPTGRFYAATFSETIFSKVDRFIHEAGIPSWLDALGFSLENGAEQLSRSFSRVTLHQLENTMILTEARPLVEVIRTGTARAYWDEAKFQHLQNLIEQELARNGSISMDMSIGLFEASEPR
jgi:ubiquinone/menaquinone biosynthesis C-methylase UbiE